MLEIKSSSISLGIDSQNIYNEVYAHMGIHQLASFYLWLLSLLGEKKGATLLDVSCGEGQLLQFAEREGAVCYGADISNIATAIAKANAPSARILVGDGEALPYRDGTFDYVTNIGSIEHYLHPERGVWEIARVLKKRGGACIFLPNSFGLFWNVWHVWRTGDIYDDGFQPIQRYASKEAWRRLLEENGLVVYKVVKYNREFPRTWGDFFWYIRHPKKLFFLALAPLVPLNLASCFAFLCYKA